MSPAFFPSSVPSAGTGGVYSERLSSEGSGRTRQATTRGQLLATRMWGHGIYFASVIPDGFKGLRRACDRATPGRQTGLGRYPSATCGAHAGLGLLGSPPREGGPGAEVSGPSPRSVKASRWRQTRPGTQSPLVTPLQMLVAEAQAPTWPAVNNAPLGPMGTSPQ